MQSADDLAIRDIELRVKRNEATDAPETVVSLYQGPEKAPKSQPDAPGVERSVEHTWDLKSVPSLKPGRMPPLDAPATPEAILRAVKAMHA